MVKDKLSLTEQETVILYNRADKRAEVFTYEPSLKRKLGELAEKYPDEVILANPDNGSGGVAYMVPKKLINIRQPRHKKELTEEEKKELAERLRIGHSAR